MQNRLYRSNSNKMLGGVCGGLGNYFHIDPTYIRLFFVILTVAGGFGVPLYLILWVVIPPEGHVTPLGQGDQFNKEEFKDRAGMMRDDFVGAVSAPNKNVVRIVGIGLVVGGAFLVLRQFDISWLNWLDRINGSVVWAVLILLAGVALLVRGTRGE
jgi:phage shock protein PspC (stress-responsive transcriptional regulator)